MAVPFLSVCLNRSGPSGGGIVTRCARTLRKMEFELERLKSAVGMGHEQRVEWLPCGWGEEVLDEETVEVD